MGQEGKTNLMAVLLDNCRVPYTLFDTLGILTYNGFKPLNPKTQKIIMPRRAIEREPLFSKACRQVWNEGNQIFAVDEMSIHQSKHFLPLDLDTVINQGGNRNIAYWFTTRRVAQIHNDILGSAHHHFIFRTYLPVDVEWYRQFIPETVIRMAQDLPKFHFIYYRLGSEAKVFQPVKKLL